MNTKILMTGSALFMGAIGIALTFMPQEILAYSKVDSAGFAPLMLQIMGALYLGLAMMNWMSREAIIGGIYNRPVVMANTIHFTVGALTLLKGLRSTPVSAPDIVLCAGYALFGVWFGVVLFRHPGSSNVSENSKAQR